MLKDNIKDLRYVAGQCVEAISSLERANELGGHCSQLLMAITELEAALCRVVWLYAPSIEVAAPEVVPADRLVTLAGPGHEPEDEAEDDEAEDEAEIERLELRSAMLAAMATHQSGGSLQVRLRALGLSGAYVSHHGVHVDHLLLVRGNGRWYLKGTEATPLEVAERLANLLVAS